MRFVCTIGCAGQVGVEAECQSDYKPSSILWGRYCQTSNVEVSEQVEN